MWFVLGLGPERSPGTPRNLEKYDGSKRDEGMTDDSSGTEEAEVEGVGVGGGVDEENDLKERRNGIAIVEARACTRTPARMHIGEAKHEQLEAMVTLGQRMLLK